MNTTQDKETDKIEQLIQEYEKQHSLINGFLTHQQKEDYPRIAQTIHNWTKGNDTKENITQDKIEQWLNKNSESLPYNP